MRPRHTDYCTFRVAAIPRTLRTILLSAGYFLRARRGPIPAGFHIPLQTAREPIVVDVHVDEEGRIADYADYTDY